MNTLEFRFQEMGFPLHQAQKIASCFSVKEIQKSDHFVNSGVVSTHFGFLEEGQLQFYSMDSDGEERTTYISLAGTFVASILSFLNEIPSKENIRALTNCRIWVIQKKDLFHLRDTIEGFKDFYIGLLEGQICCIDKNRFDLITLTKEQRYEKLMKEEPEILRQVPLQYIASMLGMTPRHLSRLRSKI